MGRIGLVFALLALGGCAGGLEIDDVTGMHPHSRLDWSYVSTRHTLALETRGNPSGEPPDRFDARLTEALNRTVRHDGVTLQRSAARPADDYRVAVAFGPAASAPVADPCVPGDIGPASHDPIVMYAAVCVGDTALKVVRGRMPVADGDWDRSFQHVVTHVMADLTRFVPPPCSGC